MDSEMLKLPLSATILCGTLEKFLNAKAVDTVAHRWQSLTFRGWRIDLTFDRDVSLSPDAEFAVPGFVVADIVATNGRAVEALLVEE